MYSVIQVISWLVTAIDSSACILNHSRAVVVAAFQGSLAVGVVVAVSLHLLAEVIHAEVVVLRQIDCLPPAFVRVPIADEVRLAVRVLGAWHIMVTAVHAMIICERTVVIATFQGSLTVSIVVAVALHFLTEPCVGVAREVVAEVSVSWIFR